MAKSKSKTKQNYRKKSKGNGKKRRKSMKKRGGNGNDIFIKFLPYGQQQSVSDYSATTSDTDKIIAHLSLGADKVGDLRQFTGDPSKYIYLYLFDHNPVATELGDESGCNYTFLDYNADTAKAADLNKFLTLTYYPEKGETKETKLTLSKIHCENPYDPMNPNVIKVDSKKKAILIYEIISNEQNVGYIMRCTDDTHVIKKKKEEVTGKKEGNELVENKLGNQIKHDLAMINLTDTVPPELKPEPQNWFYKPFETQPKVCPSTQYRIPAPPKPNPDKCFTVSHDFERVKIFTKHF